MVSTIPSSEAQTYRVDSGSDCVQGSLGGRNGDSTNTLVADAEDGLTIRDNNEINHVLLLLKVRCDISSSVDVLEMRLELGTHTILVREGDVAADWSPEELQSEHIWQSPPRASKRAESTPLTLEY